MTDERTAELLAAVRAVESGERSAASFFTEAADGAARGGSARTPGARAPQPATRPTPGPGTGPAAGPVAVPEEVRAVLAAGGAPEALAAPVVRALGEQADTALRDDPWQLLAVPGVRPEQADGFARAVLDAECGPGDERRTRALTGWLLERAALAGHTVADPGGLTKGLAEHGVPDPEEALREAADAGAMLVFEDELDAAPPDGGQAGVRAAPRPEEGGAGQGDGGDAEEGPQERPVRVLMGLDRYALAEESLADGLARLISTHIAPDGGDGADGASQAAPAQPDRRAWEEAAAAAGSPSAAELIRAAADHGLVAHTGGEAARAEPAALVAAARAMGLRAYAAAHGAHGRTRLAALLGSAVASSPEQADGEEAGGAPGHPAALTVAGLLAGREGPGRDEDGAWALDLLVVCDAPQVDAETAAAVVESLPDGARLVLSGDPQLLGSAGAGRVFADVLAARVGPCPASRTPDPGPLGELVSGIGVGELTQVAAPEKEVVIVPVREAQEAVHRTVQLVADSVPRAIGVPSADTLVVTPGHGGAAGTRALNAALKERLNPGPGRFAGFDPGDRVAHSPAPGRTALGTVASGAEDGLRMECADTGESVLVPPDRVGAELRHGWAVTAHQAAGLRRPAVVAVLPGDAAGGLTREWVYTAFSRAERHLSVVQGADEALPRAVASAHAPERTTRLRPLLVAAVRAATAPPPGEAAPGDRDSQGDRG